MTKVHNTRKPKPSENYEKFDPQTGHQVHDQAGREIPDPEPMQPPIGYNRQPSLAEQIRSMVISEKLAQAAREAGMETFEEADDFDVGDDFDQERHSPYEANFDPMTDQERSALASQGRDADRILTEAEKASLTPKPKKPKRAATSSAPLSGALANDPNDQDDEE